jgi:hypothetical protein
LRSAASGTPTAFRPEAQGCAARRYPGNASVEWVNPNGVASSGQSDRAGTPLGFAETEHRSPRVGARASRQPWAFVTERRWRSSEIAAESVRALLQLNWHLQSVRTVDDWRSVLHSARDGFRERSDSQYHAAGPFVSSSRDVETASPLRFPPCRRRPRAGAQTRLARLTRSPSRSSGDFSPPRLQGVRGGLVR